MRWGQEDALTTKKGSIDVHETFSSFTLYCFPAFRLPAAPFLPFIFFLRFGVSAASRTVPVVPAVASACGAFFALPAFTGLFEFVFSITKSPPFSPRLRSITQPLDFNTFRPTSRSFFPKSFVR